MRGTVTAFDEHRGLGEITAAAGGGRYPFHCTAIADGSRTIPTGTVVEFRAVAGPLGTAEAVEVRPADRRPGRMPTGAG